MKKILSVLMVILCMCMVTPVQAQINFGVKGGLNLSKASFSKKDFRKDNFTGFFIGPMAELTLPVLGLGFDGALLFEQRGVDIGGEQFKQNGIDIPVNLKWNIGLGSLLGVYLAAGPDFYFDFGKNKAIDGFHIDRKKSQVGINIGGGLKLLNHLQVGANYNIPLNKTANGKYETVDFSYKTKTWQVSLAYLF